MTKQSIMKLGQVGLMIDGDDTAKPMNAFTDALNVKFNGREIAQYLGNEQQPFYTSGLTGSDGTAYEWDAVKAYRMKAIMFDGFSSGAEMLFSIGKLPVTTTAEDGTITTTDTAVITGLNLSMGVASLVECASAEWIPDIALPWVYYKSAINNCPIFGQLGTIPIGKQYDWTGFDKLPSWGQQTTGNDGTTSAIEERRWSCKKMISFDNRLLALNTVEEAQGGEDMPYPSRVRWSGFAQENAFPINWDDTAANRTPEDYASVTINGYAGWQDLSSNAQIVDAVPNGDTLYVYTERETYSMSPTGNAESPFNTNLVHGDLGVLDIDCAVNARGYNYVFTGSDVVRHDSVSWQSIADDYIRDYLSSLVDEYKQGMVRMFVYPDIGELWVMVYGADQDVNDFGKTTAFTYDLAKKTWSKKTLPHIYDTEFLPLPPTEIDEIWDNDDDFWDSANYVWDKAIDKVSQGMLCGSCVQGGVYYLNYSQSEWRSVYSNTDKAWHMQQQDIQRYVERRGLIFGEQDARAFVSEMYIQGAGSGELTVTVASVDNYSGSYKWEGQTIDLGTQRRPTFRQDGLIFGYRLESIEGGTIPSGIIITYKNTGLK